MKAYSTNLHHKWFTSVEAHLSKMLGQNLLWAPQMRLKKVRKTVASINDKKSVGAANRMTIADMTKVRRMESSRLGDLTETAKETIGIMEPGTD